MLGRSTVRRQRLRALVAVASALTVVGGIVLTAGPGRAGTTPIPAEITRLSGVTASTASAAQSFGTWRGAAVRVVNDFLPADSWAEIENEGGGGPDSWKGQNVQMVWSVAMFPNDGEGANLADGAAGDYNKYFLGLAKKLVADGQGNADLRIGWEMNGNWFSWSGAKDPTDWIAYWRQIVTTMRSVSGQSFTFDWSPANNVYNVNPAGLYPGDAYVDEVGESVYDEAWGYPSSDYTDRWNFLYNGTSQSQGLAWLATFAQQHDKPMEFVEWGVAQRCDGHGGGDDPYFIQKMHDFFATHWVRLEAYYEYNPSCTTFAIDSGDFPNSAALYKKLWSADVVSATAPIIDVSYAAGRVAPVALSGQAVSTSSMYAFVSNAPSGTTKVSFYLDKATTATPTHIEGYWPWDLAGGSVSTANPFNSGALSTGTHVLTAVLSGSYGSQTIKATFTAT